MKQHLNKILRSKSGRYVAIGGFVYGIELIVIIIAQHLGANAFLAVGISFWTGLIVSFLMQKFITFQDTRTRYTIVAWQVLAVLVLVLFNFGFTLFCTWLLSSVLPVFVIRAGAIAITTIWNFYLYKSHIFSGAPLSPIE